MLLPLSNPTMKAHIHAESSAKKFGGKAKDYLAIHEFMDCSKGVVADHRHRALTHNTWFIMHILPRVFGETITNSRGKKVSVRDIGEQHVHEDYRGKFIPSAQDFLQAMRYEEWMNNGDSGYPPSHPKHKPPETVAIPVSIPAPPPFKWPFEQDEPPPMPLWPKPNKLPGGNEIYD
jgi:hypothetical protein